MKKVLITVLILLGGTLLKAQILKPVNWMCGAKRISKTEGVIFMQATIDNGWHIYSQHIKDGGPVKTSFTFVPSGFYTLSGPTIEPKSVTRYEKVFGMDVSFFEHQVIFQQKLKLKSAGPITIKGKLEFMTCNDEKCLPPDDQDFSITIK